MNNVPKIVKVFMIFERKKLHNRKILNAPKRELLTNFRSSYHTEECLVVEQEKKAIKRLKHTRPRKRLRLDY